ncbi:MAG: TetR/AcrR family transcriptional regulator [Caulobacteraceae bacterium]|nr:TetR/AcrR family transcriptional regulator [Caulobacteraceae bacterium]
MNIPTDRRAELLEKIVDALLEGGAADLSLRPLAERVGTSARLLIYHFDSKEQLVASALTEVRRLIGVSLTQRSARDRPQSLRDLLLMFWDWATDAANQRYFRLLFEVDGLAMFERISFSQEARRANSAVWVDLIGGAASRLPKGAELYSARATLIVCALNGLLQEFLQTNDLETTSSALVALIDLVCADNAASVVLQSPNS